MYGIVTVDISAAAQLHSTQCRVVKEHITRSSSSHVSSAFAYCYLESTYACHDEWLLCLQSHACHSVTCTGKRYAMQESVYLCVFFACCLSNNPA